jgi:serine/threonine protein kinase
MQPQTIGRYRILDRLGSGGMAVVYLAVDTSFERQVAVKILPSNLCADPENRERFRREAKSIAALEHTAVVPVYDYGEEGDQPYLVMRYMPGGTLKDRLTRGRIPRAAAAHILSRLSSALDKAHSLGIIHRDIKPGNILFDLEENPYIADFGLVKLMEVSSQLTQSEFFGTPAYTSPEQARGEKSIDGRADVYSLAATFFHMLTGSPPYSASNPMALMMKHTSDPIPRLADFAGELPAELQTVINRGMAKEAKERYPTAGDMARAVERILAAQPAAANQPLWETERSAGPAANFDILRARKAPPAPAKKPPAEVPTRKDAPVPAAAVKPAPVETPAPSTPPQPRRKLDWTPQPDAPAPAAETPAPASASAVIPPRAQPVYAMPNASKKTDKLSGVPLLVLFLLLAVVGTLFVLWQRGILHFPVP